MTHGERELFDGDEPPVRRGEYEVRPEYSRARCAAEKCDAELAFRRTAGGAWMPLSLRTVVLRGGKPMALSHHADCTQPELFRRPKKSRHK